MIYSVSFSNIPNFVILTTWTKSAKDSQQISEELEKEGYKDIVPHILISSKYYDCWIDRLLRSK